MAYEKLNHAEKAAVYFEKASSGLSEPQSAMYYNDQPPETIFCQGLALIKLGKKAKADIRFDKLISYADEHINDTVKIDYFAVSLPDFLVFDEDLNKKNRVHCLFMKALGLLGKSKKTEANEKFNEIFSLDNTHFAAHLYNMHNFVKQHILPKQWALKQKPVLLSSWESVYFDITEEKLCELADRVAEIGAEMLVIDDGWFGKRNDDTSSLGDWQENHEKFPGGIKAVTDYVHKRGLKLGIWVEPEMISRNSKLFEVHPDWALGSEQGRKILGRSQYILDLSRSDIQDFLIETVCSVIKESGADYLKWDFNRMFSDFTSVETPIYEVQHSYICGLYRILSEITAHYPNVLFELCASGGARFDLGMLCFMPIGWVSDNTDVLSRALIQEGTSYGYPISVMCNHISAIPNHQTKRTSTLETRCGVASFGVLGLQYDLTKLPKEELDYLKCCIAEYKRMRSFITDGSFYRLTDGFEENFNAWQLVSADKNTSYVILFQKLFFPVSQLPKLKLFGLLSDVAYTVDITGLKVSGEVLMKHGLLPLQNYQGNEQSINGHSLTDFLAVIYQLKALEEEK